MVALDGCGQNICHKDFFQSNQERNYKCPKCTKVFKKVTYWSESPKYSQTVVMIAENSE